MMHDDEERNVIRAEVLERIRPAEGAWSVDGRRAHFVVGFECGAEVGGFLTVTTSSSRLLVQVDDLRLTTREAIRLDLATDVFAPGGALLGANVGVLVRSVEGEGRILGSLTDDGRVDRENVTGFAEATVSVATSADVAALMSGGGTTAARLHIGTLAAGGAPAELRADGFARHTFLCGQSGSGKTYAMGVLLERLLNDTRLPLLIVDPNSDYVGLGTLRDQSTVDDGFPGRDVVVARREGGDIPLSIHLSDLTLHDQTVAIGLDPVCDAGEYAAYAAAVAGLGTQTFGVDDVDRVLLERRDDAGRRVAERLANLAIARWSIWAAPLAPSLHDLLDGERRPRALVLDIGSLPDRHERFVLLLSVLRRLRDRPEREAVGLVIDEAHHVCPPDGATVLQRALAEHLIWIAGEGRKYGTYLLLATQRPQKIHRNVTSQCDNVLLMRVNSASDLDALTEVFSVVPATMIAQAQAFRLGEMLVAGPIVPVPVRVHVAERWTVEGGADVPTTWTSGPGR